MIYNLCTSYVSYCGSKNGENIMVEPHRHSRTHRVSHRIYPSDNWIKTHQPQIFSIPLYSVFVSIRRRSFELGFWGFILDLDLDFLPASRPGNDLLFPASVSVHLQWHHHNHINAISRESSPCEAPGEIPRCKFWHFR